jgi:hypothetical protein
VGVTLKHSQTANEGEIMETFSISKHMAQFTDRNPRHVYTAICECKHCKNKNWVKVNSSVIPSFAKTLGFDDMLTAKDFKMVIHSIVQLKG